MSVIPITCCRICKNTDLIEVINLGEHYLSGNFPSNKTDTIIKAPLILVKCNDKNNDNCGLLQLKHTVKASHLYNDGYGYRSGLNNTMVSHLKSIVTSICEIKNITEKDIVVDIGVNDSTLLKFYQKGIKVGIDPIAGKFRKYYDESTSLITDYFTGELYYRNYTEKAAVITSISMFYDLPDPREFMSGIKKCLADDGIWVLEQSYLGEMMNNLSFDTICHEHLEYYALKQIEWMVDRLDLRVFRVERNNVNGGSFAVYVAHKNNDKILTDNSVVEFRREEEKLNLYEPQVYINFMNKCDIIKKNLVSFLVQQKKNGKKISLYGSSTKGNTLLQYFGIDTKLIDCASERNPDKYGKYTPGTYIPITSEDEVRKMKPNFMLVLPWHFKAEFLTREKEYLDCGGQFIFPLPFIDIVSSRKKVLITGINGQIGEYLRQKLNCIVYGLLHNNKNKYDDTYYFEGDATEKGVIENIIHILRPDEIYNLIAKSDSRDSTNNFLEAVQLNQMIPLIICECIRNTKIKFVNMCSAEIYRGLGIQTVDETCLETFPINPYGITKLASYHILKYYRNQYRLNCSNAILFTTESPLRRNTFLIKKLTEKAKQIRDGKDDSKIYIGNIQDKRDWVHASDVANALIKIDNGDYIVSSGVSHSVREVVEKVFKYIGIELNWVKNKDKFIGFDINTEKIYVVASGDDSFTENIIGDNSRLKSIGWKPEYTMDTLIQDMMRK